MLIFDCTATIATHSVLAIENKGEKSPQLSQDYGPTFLGCLSLTRHGRGRQGGKMEISVKMLCDHFFDVGTSTICHHSEESLRL